LAITNRNADATTVFLYLYKFIDVLKSYFEEVEEESIRDNFVIIYELMDETMDFGYPQVTESRLLKEYSLTTHPFSKRIYYLFRHSLHQIYYTAGPQSAKEPSARAQGHNWSRILETRQLGVQEE